MSKSTVDPITLTVIWNTLMSIAEELGTTLRHTAFSEGVCEGDDFAQTIRDSIPFDLRGGQIRATGTWRAVSSSEYPRTEAMYGGETVRYPHGALGDSIEASQLIVSRTGTGQTRILLTENKVFEDTFPRLTDLDGFGKTHIVSILIKCIMFWVVSFPVNQVVQ